MYTSQHWCTAYVIVNRMYNFFSVFYDIKRKKCSCLIILCFFLPLTHKNYQLKFETREFPYKIRHFFFLTGSGGSRAARIASSKTFFNPFCVRAEHSTYFTALNSRASFSADSTVIGFCLTFDSFSIVAASSRKSICVPTSRKGVLGQW